MVESVVNIVGSTGLKVGLSFLSGKAPLFLDLCSGGLNPSTCGKSTKSSNHNKKNTRVCNFKAGHQSSVLVHLVQPIF